MSRKRSANRFGREQRDNSRNGRIERREEQRIEEKKKKLSTVTKRRVIVCLALVAIFLLVLFLNSYFNYTSGSAFNPDGDTLGTRFYLSGPDPYYNMRLCEETIKQGHYAFTENMQPDPLLNYPVGGKYGRPPLFNMVAVSSAQLVNGITGMNIWDALGWCMLFLPAIYGALLVFPVYGIGKELFNRKVGLFAALLIAIIPAHIGSGHGSALSLFDHDSFLLLLATIVFYFMIKSYKAESTKRTVLYGTLAGVAIGAMELAWVAAEFIFSLILLILVLMMFIDLLKGHFKIKNGVTGASALITSFLMVLPYALITNHLFDFPLYAMIGGVAIFAVYYVVWRLDIPWVLTIPTLASIFAAGTVFVYFVHSQMITISSAFGDPIRKMGDIIFGQGIYGTKIDLTIAEANTFSISQTVMSFGPALYWVAWVGFILYLYKTYKSKLPSQNIFFLSLFITYIWLLTTAGRFVNDMIPTVTIFAGFVIWVMMEKINYKQMFKNMKTLTGFRKIRKGIKITHVGGVLFLVFLIAIPNAFLTLDAAVPNYPINQKYEMFGSDYTPVYGNDLYKSVCWADACHWLAQQDTNITDPADRPGFISWWDYGFYESSMGRHPTVADNYQSGIPPAANFQTAQSEEEAVAVLIVRLAEGNLSNRPYNPILSENVKELFLKYLPSYNATRTETDNVTGNVTRSWNETLNPGQDVINILENPKKYAPSYNQLIAPQWGNTEMRVDEYNAMYQDITNIITGNLTDDKITELYKDMQETTGHSIRYYGIDGYDVYTIFGVFAFLADKMTHGYVTGEDDYYQTLYIDQVTGEQFSIQQVKNMTQQEIYSHQLKAKTITKEAVFNSMTYRTYFGIDFGNGEIQTNQSAPTYGLRHFVPAYISKYPYPGTMTTAVLIAKYYEGARINGTVTLANTTAYTGTFVYVTDEYLGLPHDFVTVGTDGKFSLIAPAGNITVSVGVSGQYLKGITFNTTENPPITEDEATRRVPSNRTVNFDIDYASVNGTANTTNATIKIKSQDYENVEYSYKSANGSYNFKDLIPSTYLFTVYDSTNVELHNSTYFLNPGNNTYDMNMIIPTPTAPTSFKTNITNSTVNLTWAKGLYADTTYIEYNNVSGWAIGNGTIVYNGTGTQFTQLGLQMNETYYYQAWSWNERYKLLSESSAKQMAVVGPKVNETSEP